MGITDDNKQGQAVKSDGAGVATTSAETAAAGGAGTDNGYTAGDAEAGARREEARRRLGGSGKSSEATGGMQSGTHEGMSMAEYNRQNDPDADEIIHYNAGDGGKEGGGEGGRTSVEGSAGASGNDVAARRWDGDDGDDYDGGDDGNALISYLERRIAENQPESEEQRKKRERREKAEGVIGGISDAVRAVANLITVHHYAPDMYGKAEDSMSAKAKARFDKAKKERDAEEAAYYNMVMALRSAKNADEEKEYRRGREALKDKLASAKAEQEADYKELQMKVLAGTVEGKELDNELKKIRNKYAPKKEESVINKNNRTGTGKKSGGGGGTGGKGSKPYGTFMGVTYMTKPDYERAVENAGIRYNVGNNKTVTSGEGITKKTREVKKTTAEKAAETEWKAARSRKPQQTAAPAKGKTWSNTSKLKWNLKRE